MGQGVSLPQVAKRPRFRRQNAAWRGGWLTPFATGVVVASPTLFRFADGTGLMGEAGPEAIMPLQRGRDGRLGVSANGGGRGEVNHFDFGGRTYNVGQGVSTKARTA